MMLVLTGGARQRDLVAKQPRPLPAGNCCCCWCHPHLMEKVPISNPHTSKGLFQRNPCSFIAKSELLWPQGLHITEAEGITRQKKP